MINNIYLINADINIKSYINDFQTNFSMIISRKNKDKFAFIIFVKCHYNIK